MNGLFNECGCTIKITNERDSKDCMDVYFEWRVIWNGRVSCGKEKWKWHNVMGKLQCRTHSVGVKVEDRANGQWE